MSDVDTVREKLNIVDIVSERVKLKKAGRNLKGLCPFHNEKTPSFMVSPERQMFHCFGCGRGGSVYDFVMEYEHIDFAEALEELAIRAGVTLSQRASQTPEIKRKEQIHAVNHLASEYYQYILASHSLGGKARDYLKNRGVSEKSIKTFGVGYSPNSWESLYRFLRKKGYDDRLIDTAGLVVKSQRGYYDRFRGRIMFTLKDHRGNVVGFAGRVLDPEIKEAKYINTTETPVYVKSNVLYGLDVTKGEIQKANEAVVMEGELDVISSFQAGIGNVVAIKGSALTEGHVNLLRRYAERVVLALDSDVAGDSAARRGIDIAESAGLSIHVAKLPEGKDPDDLAREAPVVLRKAIKDALTIYDYFIWSANNRFGGQGVFGKKKIGDEVLPELAKIENPIVQSHYVKKLADVLDVSEQTVYDGMRKVRRETKGFVRQSPEKESGAMRSRPEKLEFYILALLLQGKTADLFDELLEYMKIGDFVHAPIRQILEKLQIFLGTTGLFLVKDFADSLPKELVPILDEAFLWDLSDIEDQEELYNREWMKALKEFRRSVLHRKIKDLTYIIKNTKKEDDPEGEQHYNEMLRVLTGLTEELKVLEKVS